MAIYYGYARVSTDNQHDTSIQVQLKFLKDRADKLGMEFVIVHEKESGVKFGDRTEFNNMIVKSQSGDIIGVYDASRFGRQTKDNLDYVATLEKKGVGLDCSGRIINYNKPDDKLMFGLSSVIATYQRDIQREKSLKGIQQTKENGDWILRGDLFGYNLSYVRGKPVVTINETEASYVRIMYEEYAKGRSILSLSNEYKNHVFKNTNFKLDVSAISRMLFKPIYMGYYTIPCLKTYDSSEKKTKGYTRIAKTPRSQLEKDLVKSNHYLPIVSEELWWKVHETYRFLNRKHATQYAYRSTPYELTGILKSSCCGTGFVHWNSKKGYIGELYKINRHKPDCTEKIFKGVRKDLVECVMRMTFFLTFTDSHCGQFFEERRAYFEKMVEDSKDYRKTIEDKKRETLKKKNNLIDYIQQFGADKEINNKIIAINEELEKYEKELKGINESESALDDDIAEYIKLSGEEIIDQFINALTAEVRRNMYSKYCSAIMSRDTLTVTYENGMKYVVTWHKYRYMTNKPLPFVISFRDKELDRGTIEPLSKKIAFIHVRETDEFMKAVNDLADKKAEMIMKYLNETPDLSLREEEPSTSG